MVIPSPAASGTSARAVDEMSPMISEATMDAADDLMITNNTIANAFTYNHITIPALFAVLFSLMVVIHVWQATRHKKVRMFPYLQAL